MDSSAAGGFRQPRDAARKNMPAPEENGRTEHAQMAANLARTVMQLEAVARVEKEVAQTLRAMAGRNGSSLAARRLKLAGDAVQGAHAAAEHSRYLREQAHRWEEQDEVIQLHQALRRAGAVLADLARTEKRIADILENLAGQGGTELAAQRQQLAREASAGARRANARARALRQMAETDAAKARPQ